MPKDTRYTCQVRALHGDRIEAARANVGMDEAVQGASRLFKALGDPTRLRILQALTAGELCVCDISHLLDMSVSSVSHQLRVLRGLELVAPRREGKVVFYSLKDTHVETLLDSVLSHLEE